MSSEAYEYTPLSGNKIRLIHLSPPSWDSSTPGLVELSLSHRDLDEKPEYNALSYAWGDPKVTEPILLDGVLVHVTTNLAAALQHPALWHSQQYLWVDAICINQRDIKERGSQVSKMTEIYRNAEQVLVWLGICSPTLQFAVTKLRGLPRILEPAKEELEKAAGASGRGFRWDDVVRHCKDEVCEYMEPDSSEGKDLWTGLNELYDLLWWERSWILQEVECAKEVRFICGTLMVDLDWMKCRESCISRVAQDKKVAGSGGAAYFRQRSVLKVLYVKDTCQLDDTFLNLLDWGRTSIATDPRDKIFAFLGLASDISPGDLTPSYFFSTEKVYTDVVLWHIAKYNSLDIFGHCFPYPVVDNLPSWVPDWSLRWYRPNPEHQYRQNYGPLRNAYNASKESMVLKPNERIEDIVTGDRYLKLSGINIGTIVLSTDRADDDLYLGIQKTWIPENKAEIYSWTGETNDKAFRHTIVGDRCPDQNLQRGFACDIDWDVKVTPRKTVSARVQTFTARRLFAVTDNGMMGIAPGATLTDDSVFVLLGGSVLYVLRYTGAGRYKLIGEAYFHGMMDGEALDRCEQGEFQLQDIILE
ncbi:heterokaryon incompatibility protein-domain-containing protein [Cadophora sp. MPI-SDFR-AT-0126]|nr:heterokaryon incompatibility protein-domain-containing protein [Leotiomycetes sp. MPI-SDFR-AT-0126]